MENGYSDFLDTLCPCLYKQLTPFYVFGINYLSDFFGFRLENFCFLLFLEYCFVVEQRNNNFLCAHA